MKQKDNPITGTNPQQPQPKTSWLRGLRRTVAFAVLAMLSLALPCSLMAGPIIVRINDVPNASPVIHVQNAPNGYFFYTDDSIADPAIEEGGLIILPGANPSLATYNWGGRFIVPSAPNPNRQAVDIIWIESFEDFLIVGFNSALPGIFYRTPGVFPNTDENLGPVTDNWVQVYADELIVVLYKPHTYRLRD